MTSSEQTRLHMFFSELIWPKCPTVGGLGVGRFHDLRPWPFMPFLMAAMLGNCGLHAGRWHDSFSAIVRALFRKTRMKEKRGVYKGPAAIMSVYLFSANRSQFLLGGLENTERTNEFHKLWSSFPIPNGLILESSMYMYVLGCPSYLVNGL